MRNFRDSFPLWLLISGMLICCACQRASAVIDDLLGKEAPEVRIEEFGGKHFKLSDFRGKWVVYERAGVWCPPSELLAEVFSILQRQLQDQPFQFVASLSDPTVEDVEVCSNARFSGRRGVLAEGTDAGGYDYPSIPVYVLIDPKGMVRHVGHGMEEPRALRLKMLSLLQANGFPKIPGGELSADEATWEEVLTQKFRGDYRAQYPLLERLRTTLPDDQYVPAQWALPASYAIGMGKAEAILQKEVARLGSAALPSLRYKLAHWLVIDDKPGKAAEMFSALQREFPPSVYLRAYLTLLANPPDKVSQTDFASIYQLTQAFSSVHMKAYVGLWLEAHDRRAEAVEFLDGGEALKGEYGLLQAGFLHRLGKDAEALQIATAASGQFDEKTANPVQAWRELRRRLMVEDWPATLQYAGRYAEVRADKLLGPAAQLLALLRTGDAAGAEGLRAALIGKVSTLKTSRLAAGILQQEKSPTTAEFQMIKDHNDLLATTLLAGAVAELAKDKAAAWESYSAGMLAFPPSDPGYAILYQVRAGVR